MLACDRCSTDVTILKYVIIFCMTHNYESVYVKNLPVNVGHRQGKHSNVRMEERVLSLNLKGTLCILAGEVNRHTF